MPNGLKRSAFGLTALAIVFLIFFQSSKHNPAYARVNPFGEDPYDAVGSFGVQFVAFAALLSLVRAFRPYPQGPHLEGQRELLARGLLMGYLGVGATLLVDAVALVRHPTMWFATSAGNQLLLATGALLLWATLASARVVRLTGDAVVHRDPGTWSRALGVVLLALLIAGIYPEVVRHTLVGSLLTVVVGMALLFVPVRALGTALVPGTTEEFGDFLDDIAAIYGAIKQSAGRLRPVLGVFEELIDSQILRTVFDRLDPRRNRWILPTVAGIGIGAGLVGAEFAGDNGKHFPSHIVLVAAVYIGLESAGVLMGYALLAEPLGLVRRIRVQA